MLNLEKIETIMTRGVFSVDFDDSVKKADDLMKEEKIKHVPVVDGSKFIGMITERTLMEYTLRQIYEYDDTFGEIGYNKISEFENVMARDVHVIYPEDSIAKAIEIMTKKRVDYLPVVDWDKNLVGIVTAMDILMFIKNK